MSPQRQTRDPVRPTGTVVGLFHKSIAAERAIRDLKDGGFTDQQIGVLMRDPDEQRRLAEETDNGYPSFVLKSIAEQVSSREGASHPAGPLEVETSGR